jgi:hypothetical protein
MAKTKGAKRELINTGRDERFVRRSATGQFKGQMTLAAR